MDFSSILPLLLGGKADEKTTALLKAISGGGKADIASVLSGKDGNLGAIASVLGNGRRKKNLHNRFVLSFINDDILGKITKFMAK